MITFRKATLDDVETLARVRVRFLCEGRDDPPHDRRLLERRNAEFFAQSMAADSFVAWIAQSEGEIVATSGLTIYRIPPNRACPNGRMGYISNLFTEPPHRRRGLGSRLVALTVEEAKLRGCDRVILNATDMGRRIYERLGFEHDGNSMRLFPRARLTEIGPIAAGGAAIDRALAAISWREHR